MLDAAQSEFRLGNRDLRAGMCHRDQRTDMPVRKRRRPATRTRGTFCSFRGCLTALRPAEHALQVSAEMSHSQSGGSHSNDA